MMQNVMSMSIIHFNARAPVPTKLGQEKLVESSCTSTVSRVYDSPTVTARYY